MATIDITTLPREFWSLTLPTSGTFALGDRIKLMTGGCDTYVCTTAGTAGSGAVFTLVGGAGYTDEQVRDVMGVALVAGTGISVTPNDAADTITVAATGASPTTFVVKSADTTVNNSATTASDPHLTATLAVGSYTVESFLHYSATTTADINIAWTTPSGTTFPWASEGAPSNATSGLSVGVLTRLNVGQPSTLGGIGAGVPIIARPVGYMTVTNAGVVTLKWAQLVAEATDAIMYAGSWLRFTKVA